MAIATYSDLKTAIYAWVDASSGDFSGTTIDDLILLAHQRINREVRCREMEASISATISGGVVPLPAGFIDLKYAYLSNDQPHQYLTKRTADFIHRRYPHRQAAGEPRYVAREFSELIFGPYPDAGETYIMSGAYWKRQTLTATATFNEVFRAHPDLYLAASIAEAIPFLGQDSRLAVWEPKYQQIKNDLMMEVNNEGYEGSEVDF